MRTLIVYESMYGNTHLVANRIGDGLRPYGEVNVVPTDRATDEMVHAADLVLVGGPTHVHGMSTETSRAQAVEAAKDGLPLDPDSEGPGLRDWFHGLTEVRGIMAAAFDTRFAAAPALVTGRASKGITHKLHKHGFNVVADPESFLVDKANHLLDDEQDRATSWGARLAMAYGEGPAVKA